MTEIFVFGSNLAGRHGKGAALHAKWFYGAEQGTGFGPTGRAYAIPTKNEYLKTLSLNEIELYVRMFKHYARSRPDLTFLLTPIGCGLAGYKPHQIGPMFKDSPSNVIMPREFVSYV